MDYLPHDPAILVSSVNLYLRDEIYDTLESLCYAYGRDPEDLKAYLRHNGYRYDAVQRQFKAI